MNELKASIFYDLVTVLKASCHGFDKDYIIGTQLINNLEKLIENYSKVDNSVQVDKCVHYIADYQVANKVTGQYEHIKGVCECGERSVEHCNFLCKDNPECYFKQLERLKK